jgi:hypothetical protein
VKTDIRNRLALGLVTTLLAGGAAAGGYAWGVSSGEDLEAASAKGTHAGTKDGTAKGKREGHKRGFDKTFQNSFDRAFDRGYKFAFEEKGLPTPDRRSNP